MAVAMDYFKEKVDKAYSRHYFEVAYGLLMHVLAALGIWFVLLLSWVTYRWIAAGR